MNNIKQVHYLWVDSGDGRNWKKCKEIMMARFTEEFLQFIERIKNTVEDELSKNGNWLPLISVEEQDTGRFYYNHELIGLFPDMQFGQIEKIVIRDYQLPPTPAFQYTYKEKTLSSRCLTQQEFIQLFGRSKLDAVSNKFNWDLSNQGYFLIESNNSVLNREGNSISKQDYQITSYDRQGAIIPFIPIQKAKREETLELLILLWKLGLCPEWEEPDLKSSFIQCMEAVGKYISVDGKHVTIEKELLAKEITRVKEIPHLGFLAKSDSEETCEIPKIQAQEWERCVQKLLQCDKVRSDLPIHRKERLSAASGHWEVFENIQFDSPFIKSCFAKNLRDASDKLLFARDPLGDLKRRPSYVAIDFGTKSTVVALCDDRGIISPCVIGQRPQGMELTSRQFENPTVLKFVNTLSFLEAYHQEGRPDTRWNDVSASYSAANDQRASSAEDIMCFMDRLKQWTNNRCQTLNLVDGQKRFFELENFLDMEDGAFDPIEIYAYYVGLYINNMADNRVYLDYLMAYPAAYPLEVCEKIRSSFERGLKKSLPTSVQKDEKTMSRFRVETTLSEPSSYAVCAIEATGLCTYPKPFLYGIYDFGGGTTDFSIGICQPASQTEPNLIPSSYDDDQLFNDQGNGENILIELAEGGEPFLGGENLLEEAAYRIFTKTVEKYYSDFYSRELEEGEEQDKMAVFLENIRLTAPAHCRELKFAKYISDDFYARKNMLNLIEEIRPFWEGEKSLDQVNSIRVLFYYYKEGEKGPTQEEAPADTLELPMTQDISENPAKTDENQPIAKSLSYDLEISQEDFQNFFRSKIEKGVNHFYALLDKTRALLQSPEREASVWRKFSKYNIRPEEIEDVHIFLSGNASRSELLRKLIKDRNNQQLIIHDSFEAERSLGAGNWSHNPTIKTGIAYGLLIARPGQGDYKVLPMEKSSRYFIGRLDRNTKCFQAFQIPEEGYCFARISRPSYILYYTDNPNAPFGSLSVTQIHGMSIELDEKQFDLYLGAELCVKRKETAIIEIFIREQNGGEYMVNSYDLENLQTAF